VIDGSVEIEWHGVRLVLLPDRAVWLPEERAVLVADVHLGKPASFRSMGVPVPEAVTAGDLGRLTGLAQATGCERLIVLGDLIHDSAALRDRTRDAVLAWRGSLSEVAVDLIPGNHDRKARSCEPLGVGVLAESAAVGGLVLTHEPPVGGDVPTLCGHVHPVVSIGGARSPARVRSACFWFEGAVGILPAFGGFTGGRAMRVHDGVGAFAAGDRAVIPVTGLGDSWVRAGGSSSGRPAYDRA